MNNYLSNRGLCQPVASAVGDDIGYITTYLLEAIASATLGRVRRKNRKLYLQNLWRMVMSGRCIPRNY